MAKSLEIDSLLPSYLTHLRSKQRKLRTIELADEYVHRLSRWLSAEGEPTQVGQISNRLLELYFADLGETHKTSTVAIHYRTLRAFWGWLDREDEIDTNPFRLMTEPKPEDEPVPVFSDDELRALLETTTGRSFNERGSAARSAVLESESSGRSARRITLGLGQ